MADKPIVKKFRSALITGSYGGLGAALARLIAKKKIPLMLHGRNQQLLTEQSQILSKFAPIDTIACDLVTAAERQPLCTWIKRHQPDLVINNAGFGLYGEALSYTDKEQLDILRVNAEAALELTLVAARALIAAGHQGTILNVCSAAAFHPFPALAVYAASKAFVKEFSYSLDCELAPYGVRVLASCPGMIDTGFRTRAGAPVDITREEQRKTIPRIFDTMSAKDAAQLIWQQVLQGEAEQIIDWRSRWGSRLGRWLLPRSWMARILQRSIHQRVGKRPLLLD